LIETLVCGVGGGDSDGVTFLLR